MIRRDVDLSSDKRIALDTLSLLLKKWHPIVVLVLLRHGPMGFNELLEAIPDLSGKVLTETLEALRDAGLLERTVVNDSPLRVTYDLTAAGRDLEPIFESLTAWGARHLESTTPSVLLVDADRRITDMYGEWLTDRYTVFRAHNGDELETQLHDALDVVLFDDGLPGITARELADRVAPSCRTIVLVGDRPSTDLLELDCDDVLRKPIVRETVLEAIDEQLSRQGEPAEQRKRAAQTARLSLLESIYPQEQLMSSETYTEARSWVETLEE